MARDYYDILGVKRGASKEEIKQAFHKRAHEHHPDKLSGNEAKFKEVNEAYQVLSDDNKRTQYDQFGSAFQGGTSGSGAGFSGFGSQGFSDFSNAQGQGVEFDLGDIFNEFFGGGRGRGESANGRDIHIDVTINLAEAVFGIKKEISLFKNILCDRCQGSGGEPKTGSKNCAVCKGLGKVTRIQQTMLGNFKTSTTCVECMGEGKIPNKKCAKCLGEAVVKNDKKIELNIPAGIDNGQMIRAVAEGEAAKKGVRAGDLLVTVHVENDTRFVREGPHLLTDVEIPISKAVLGGKVEIVALDGKTLSIKIPSGIQSGKILRISGKGAGMVNAIRSGDLLITVKVKTPTNLSRKHKKLFGELEEEGF